MLYARKEAHPFDRLLDFRRDFDRFFDQAFSWNGPGFESASFAPSFELDEDQDGLTIRVELPGVKPEDLTVSVEGNVLSVAGERHAKSSDDANLHRSERAFGKFSQSLRLPAYLDSQRIDAKHENGILTLRVDRAEAAKPLTIAIEAA